MLKRLFFPKKGFRIFLITFLIPCVSSKFGKYPEVTNRLRQGINTGMQQSLKIWGAGSNAAPLAPTFRHA